MWYELRGENIEYNFVILYALNQAAIEILSNAF